MTASDDDETAPDAAGAAADPLAATLAAVRTETTPEAAERTELHSVVADLIERAGAAVESLPSPADEADVLHVGSTARGTWLPGDRDVDLFVRFPTALDREELEEYGLRVGHETLPDSREAFAEHPYVVGSYDGFDVDLVPCFDVASATEIRSAVDRTPFHTAYLDERLDGDLAADVRVFKQFLTAIGAYGSDLRTRGFSGYLAELLVVVYGGVEPLLRAAGEEWHPPVRFDPEEHGTETFDDPLVVIDPTDPERNVAAVCAPANVARLQHHARQLLDDPDTERFRRREREPLDADAVAEHVTRRGTDPVAVVVDVPPLVDDQLYPQLRRSLAGIER
ncbi:MAG: CCA tRNA nucleotidyltransferase, partial [Halobaculum sp.]